jgi:autotransporter-associated beta strand protein/YVTN family beta-propeller protein
LSTALTGALAMFAPDVACAQAGLLLYVPNALSNNLSAYSTAANGTLTSTTTIAAGSSPASAAVRGDQAFAYVTIPDNNSVSVIDTVSQTIVQTVATGAFPYGVAVGPDGLTVYVANHNADTVSVYAADPLTGQLTPTTTISTGVSPRSLAVSPDGTRLYVVNQFGDTLGIYNTATNALITNVAVGSQPLSVATNPAGTLLYVTNFGSQTVSVISTATDTVVATVSLLATNPREIVVSPDGNTVYTADSNGKVIAISAATNQVIGNIASGSSTFGLAISPDGSTLYATNGFPSNNVAMFSVNTSTGLLTSLGTIAAGTVPLFPGMCGNGSGMLVAGATFVANTSGAISCVGTTATFTGGTLLVNGSSLSSSVAVSLGAAGGTIDTSDNSLTLSGTIGGAGGLIKTGAGTLTLSGTSTYTGATNVNAGTLQAGAANAFSPASAFTVAGGAVLDLNNFSQSIGSLAGAGNVTLGAATLTTGNDNTSTMFSGAISGTGGLTKTGAGTLTLSGTSGYTGATAVNAGALIVNGSIASSSGLTVAAGALVGGNGFLPSTTINGILSPGNSIGTITVNGNLTFAPGAFSLVEVSPTAADRTNVTGTATLAGNVLATFAPGSYIAKQYTILHADGGLGGTTFGGLATANVPTNFSANLGYSANDVFLNLTAALGSSVNGLNQNQVNVATVINGFFNSGGALPPNFLSLFNLTGANLATALSQLSGEAATAAQYGAFQLGNQFFALMLDPLVYGRGPSVGIAPGGGAMRLAAEETQPPEIALAYAKILKEPPAPPAPLLWERRWNVWAGGYGGTNRTEGDPAVIGSHDVTARTGGYGAGIDYRIWPGTTVGVALAGGFTNWGLASGLGGGNSDVFQAGLYGITRNGPAYLAGALAFAEHWMSTDRFAFAGDHLTARFNAQNYGGRIEGGWRFATFLGGVAPYAAVQAQGFHTPAYNEADATLGGFGLNYNARNGSDTRSELGARFDQALPIATTAVLALNARAAWAHDWVTTPVLNPLFQTLPGTLFAVTGATPVPNSALAPAGAELRFLNGWALAARFDGEFADRAQTYAGTGTIRYVW